MLVGHSVGSYRTLLQKLGNVSWFGQMKMAVTWSATVPVSRSWSGSNYLSVGSTQLEAACLYYLEPFFSQLTSLLPFPV